MEFPIIPYFRLNCCRRDDYDVPLMNNKAFQETLCIVGAEACAGIEHLIRASGLSILLKKRFHLRPEQAERFFRKTSEDLDDDLKAFIIDWMTAGPVEVSIIAGIDAVSRWLDLIGQADCISVYGSPNVQTARVDIRFFYPDAKLVGDLHNQMGDARQYLAETVSPLLIKGLVKLCKEKPQIPVLWLAQWLLDNRPHER
ncbi:nucleoside diphosphate kinase homolog 5-like [Uloborus diversus]|uniref:nucleoside diphosphate kinase homolog 5-like n=1 Tax=Uloborus diversus TaxID=327109 RepID=UPI00240927FF|nr:nucleoside diphosphate kinase homolog 5-like [Uloborus diversus]